MRILHTSDWHLGKKLFNFPRFPEQVQVMNEICEIADKGHVDTVIIAGDLFDTFNPPAEAIELFYKTTKRLSSNNTRIVIAIAGNHDSPERIEAPNPIARECGIIFLGHPQSTITSTSANNGYKITNSEPGFIEFQIPKYNYPVRIISTPYANEKRLKTFFKNQDEDAEIRLLLTKHWHSIAKRYCDSQGVNILTTHLYVTNNKNSTDFKEPEDAKPILHIGGSQPIFTENLPEKIQYAALGHLHRCQIVSNTLYPIVYSGSPIAYTFSEEDQSKYVVIVDIKPGKRVFFSPIELKNGKKLLRNTFNNVDKAVKWLLDNKDALVEITLKTDTYLTAEQKNRLYNSHNGIVSIIPGVKDTSNNLSSMADSIDLSKGMNELFTDYFEHRTGQKPSDEIVQVFKEILSVNEEET